MPTKKNNRPAMITFAETTTSVLNTLGESIGVIFHRDEGLQVFEPDGSALTAEELTAIASEMVARAKK